MVMGGDGGWLMMSYASRSGGVVKQFEKWWWGYCDGATAGGGEPVGEVETWWKGWVMVCCGGDDDGGGDVGCLPGSSRRWPETAPKKMEGRRGDSLVSNVCKVRRLSSAEAKGCALMSMGRVFKTHLRRRGVKQSGEIDIEFKIVDEYTVKSGGVVKVVEMVVVAVMAAEEVVTRWLRWSWCSGDEDGGEVMVQRLVVVSRRERWRRGEEGGVGDDVSW
ncbi:hypothetical protein Tco_0490982 [Tanacetum coccineum]